MVSANNPSADPQEPQQGSGGPSTPQDLDKLARDLKKKIDKHLGRGKKS